MVQMQPGKLEEVKRKWGGREEEEQKEEEERGCAYSHFPAMAAKAIIGRLLEDSNKGATMFS